MDIRGIIVPLITPFSEDGNIDKESFQRLIDYIIPAGIHGVFPCSTTGEFQHLSRGERFGAIEIVIKAVRGRVPVFAGVTERSMEETISNIKGVERLKPDAIVIAPLVYRGNRKLPQHMERIKVRGYSNAYTCKIILYSVFNAVFCFKSNNLCG